MHGRAAAGWPVGIGSGAGAPVVVLREGALATSGTSRRRWRHAGEVRHHLLDPASGLPASAGLREVSVAAGSCTAAEVAATACAVGGPAAARRLLTRHGLAGLLTVGDGARLPVGAWPVGAAA